jgi:hypothetical protein
MIRQYPEQPRFVTNGHSVQNLGAQNPVIVTATQKAVDVVSSPRASFCSAKIATFHLPAPVP